MEKYKYMLGQAHAYQFISGEISNLLNKGAKDGTDGKIVDLGKRQKSQSIKMLWQRNTKKKIKKRNKKEVDGYERLKTKETSKLPQPTGWRLLVLTF